MPPTSGLCLLLLFALISVGTYEPASPPALSLVVAVDVSGSARDSMGVRGTELVKFFRELIANDSSIEIALVGFNEAGQPSDCSQNCSRSEPPGAPESHSPLTGSKDRCSLW